MEAAPQTRRAARDDGDIACLTTARGQFGALGRFQALTFLSPKAIQHRVRTKRWNEIVPGVYVIQGCPPSREQEIMVAVLWAAARRATRARSCASHTTAAYVHRLCDFSDPIHLITPRNLRSDRDWFVVHRMDVDPVDIERVGPIPVTTVARTILDLGAVKEIDEVESCLEKALFGRKVSIPRLEWQLERSEGKGVRGTTTLRRLLEDRTRGYIPSESELELRLVRILRSAKLPVPVKQKVIKDGSGKSLARVDFYYPGHRLVLEVNGWRYHSGRDRWQRDLARGNELVVKGERVLVFTWSDVVRNPSKVARIVRDALQLTDPQTSFPLGRPTRA